MSASTTTEQGPCTLFWPDGSVWTTEREVTRVDDWRPTPWGMMNFGHVRFGPQRFVQVKEPT